jgi:antagonist of KipI
MSIHVIRAGLMTTVQDEGRWGFQTFGVPVSGPMDWYSHRAANRMVDNPDMAATLEVTLIGPELEFGSSATVAFTGARFHVEIDGRTAAPGTTHALSAGARLQFAAREAGARAYLAVGGGISVPPVLGSRSTHVAAGLGGVQGRPLKAGDRLAIGEPDGRRASRRAVPVPFVPLTLPAGGARVRVLPGPQAQPNESVLASLLGSRYSISPQSDRFGYRLEGTALSLEAPTMISDAVGVGWVQVTPSGQPILLMADRQTTGGYPVIACVITADLPLAGQLAPGDWIEFERCDRAEAIRALRSRVAPGA